MSNSITILCIVPPQAIYFRIKLAESVYFFDGERAVAINHDIKLDQCQKP